MEEDWGHIFRGLQSAHIEEDQRKREEVEDIGEDTEEYIHYMLIRETDVSLEGFDNKLPTRTFRHGWLLKARKAAIKNIVETAGEFGYRQITVYMAVVYVDRYLSLIPIKSERFWIAKLLSAACLELGTEESEDVQLDISEYEEVTGLNSDSIDNMKDYVLEEFEWITTCVTPIQFTKYFLSIFCRNDLTKDYVRKQSVEVIMSILGDVRLMSKNPFIIALAATLLASNTNELTMEQIQAEIDVLPQQWIVKLDDVCSCYNSLLKTNKHRLFPVQTLNF